MWDQYLEIAISLTREFWPLLGTVMLVLVIPWLILRVGRHGHLALKSVNELNARIEELQAALNNAKIGGPVSEAIGKASAAVPAEDAKEQEAEKVFEAFAKACQEKSASQEVKDEVQEETVAQAREEFSFDGNLAVDQPHFSEPVAASAPQPKVEAKPASVPLAAAKKDRSVVQCNNCGNKLAYKGEWAGKRVKCPSCKDVIALP